MDINLSKYIIKTINTKQFKNIFYNKTANRKYNVELLINSIIFILRNGLSYREFINLLKNFNTHFLKSDNNNIPHYSTIFKFYAKLIKYNIIYISYLKEVNKYINKNKSNKFIVDTTFINNKLGIDFIGYNNQIPKHKLSKVSIITNIKGIPLDIKLNNGNSNDAKIIITQLDNFMKTKIKLNNKNIIIGDAAYDSNNLRKKLENINFGKLIVPKNKRNTKNENILKSYKLNYKEKKLLKNRYKIEFTNNRLKQFKRINIKYDKLGINYLNYLYLACINIMI